MFDNAVVGVDDYVRARDALELAKTLVSADAAVTLAYVEVVQTEPTSQVETRAADERQRSGLERLRRLADAAQMDADVTRVEASSVRAGLHDLAAMEGADVLVIGAGSRDRIEHVFLEDQAREVLDDPPCAVAVAPHGYAAPSGGMSRIGVGYNGSPESERALAVARRIAAERHARLSAYQAVHAPVYAHDVWNVEGEIDAEVDKARERMAALGGVEPHAELADDPVKGLRRYGASVDLLVLGAHKYRSPGRAPHASKAQRLADEPASPLLVLATSDDDR